MPPDTEAGWCILFQTATPSKKCLLTEDSYILHPSEAEATGAENGLLSAYGSSVSATPPVSYLCTVLLRCKDTDKFPQVPVPPGKTLYPDIFTKFPKHLHHCLPDGQYMLHTSDNPDNHSPMPEAGSG